MTYRVEVSRGQGPREAVSGSAFSTRVYGWFPRRFFEPGIRLARDLFRAVTRAMYRLPFYAYHDAFLMFYRPARFVRASLLPVADTAWRLIVRSALASEDYFAVNRAVSGYTHLAALAAAQFLKRVVEELERRGDPVKGMSEPPSGDQQRLALEALRAARESVEEYQGEVEEAASAIAVLVGAGGEGYAHTALPVTLYAEKPDEWRRRVWRLVSAARIYRRLVSLLPQMPARGHSVMDAGEVSGVTRMERESQLKDLLPHELALAALPEPYRRAARSLLAARIVSRQAAVLERTGVSRPIVYVDKSGSMDERAEGFDAPKVSVAAALALALHRRLGADVYFFDTEVRPADPARVVWELLTVRAAGGTRIEMVLRHAASQPRTRPVVIVSDAIDDVPEEAVKALEGRRVTILHVPPGWRSGWVDRFRVVEAKTLLDLARAVT